MIITVKKLRTLIRETVADDDDVDNAWPAEDKSKSKTKPTKELNNNNNWAAELEDTRRSVQQYYDDIARGGEISDDPQTRGQAIAYFIARYIDYLEGEVGLDNEDIQFMLKHPEKVAKSSGYQNWRRSGTIA